MDLMDKKIDDLTVGDTVKLNIGILAITGVVIGGLALIGTAADKIRDRRAQKKFEKNDLNES